MGNSLGAVANRAPWRPDSWQEKVAAQQAIYPDAGELDKALTELSGLPPLVTSWEILALREQIAEAQRGERFFLQGGDCAESFAECNSAVITNRLKVLLQMSLILVHGLQMPVVRVGRFAGQYAKPRSSNDETRDGVTLPSYRGDIINSPEFTPEARIPDPRRLIQAHASSAMTMNFVRALVDGGFADLHHPEYWNLGWVEHSPLAEDFQQLATSIGRSVRFMETISGRRAGSVKRVDFYTSHEALHLHYEQALTREVPRQEGWWNLSTHFPWIGMRTASMEDAHLEFMRGIRNPIGMKVGPSVEPGLLTDMLEVLNPNREEGKIVLIHRMGAGKVADKLPKLIRAVQDSGSPVLWICDPMHGNTESTADGIKTRRFRNIMAEVDEAFDVHHDNGSRLGGVHLELTGEDVTECTGGARDLVDADLRRAYKSTVDPRLNYEQALELAMLIVRKHETVTRNA
ncbi:3-deoxy-7-phosphoheptulonate synthase class II [Marinihelvus fidelis]|uniref:Phospho-2-dehydro-3-deoxyheptonate aldolase n=2 Tax=Marinihelvus fidelis TaxID=2613842 RepID=A0A5N0TBL2_9GAMM|nr:3-deoxy-7-phosphoheptulonate synthase class II [Marinihelvus fidelis]